jgi:hypothetical protein
VRAFSDTARSETARSSAVPVWLCSGAGICLRVNLRTRRAIFLAAAVMGVCAFSVGALRGQGLLMGVGSAVFAALLIADLVWPPR